MKKRNLLGLDEDRLVGLALELDNPAYRGRQLYRQIYCRRQFDLDGMSDLSRSFRARLARDFHLRLPELAGRTVSSDQTIKYLFRLEDGRHVETVFIPERRRRTLCISSQVGCGVGCTFCMTARMGFERNLGPGEIVGQVLAVIEQGELPPRGFNIVFMGMGEPLFNCRNVMQAFRLLCDRKGMGLSRRRITVSTAGVVPVLRRLQHEPVVPNLAISLNAAEDPLRTSLMPLNARWNLDQLLEACRGFGPHLGERITFEYVLLRGVNDSEAAARRLVSRLAGLRCKVNLIPYNPGPGLPYQRPPAWRVERFQRILKEAAVATYLRRPRGDDVAAACGQLAHFRAHGEVNDAA